VVGVGHRAGDLDAGGAELSAESQESLPVTRSLLPVRTPSPAESICGICRRRPAAGPGGLGRARDSESESRPDSDSDSESESESEAEFKSVTSDPCLYRRLTRQRKKKKARPPSPSSPPSL